MSPRANTALPLGFAGTRVGYVPIRRPDPWYWPSKGAALANQQISRRPQTIIRARKLAAEWLAKADPLTCPGFVTMADYWGALNDHIAPRGEMAIFLRYNHN